MVPISPPERGATSASKDIPAYAFSLSCFFSNIQNRPTGPPPSGNAPPAPPIPLTRLTVPREARWAIITGHEPAVNAPWRRMDLRLLLQNPPARQERIQLPGEFFKKRSVEILRNHRALPPDT